MSAHPTEPAEDEDEDVDSSRKTCSCGMAWADEPGHDDDNGDVPQETGAAPATRDELIEHLREENGHRVLRYDPVRRPSELDLDALRKWHEADHGAMEQEPGAGPLDQHRHQPTTP